MIPPRPDAPTLAAAADWHVRHAAGLTPAEQAEFDTWLATDRRHAAAWRELEGTLVALDQVVTTGQAETLVRELARRRRRRRRVAVVVAALALAACVLLLFALSPRTADPAVPAASAAPVIVRATERQLEDGSRVTVQPDAAIAVRYSAARREVQLLQGEALFTVEPDPARPFVVIADQVEVRAIGTAFAVRTGARAVAVLVTAGQVTVTPTAAGSGPAVAGGTTPIVVEAGRELALMLAAGAWDHAARPARLSEDEINRRLAWRQPRMHLMGTTLAEAVAALNRENRVQIVIADPLLRRLQLTGVYRLDDAEGFVRLLETHFGASIERRPDHTLVIRQN